MTPPVVLYAVSAVYFAGVMVRLMLTLTPIVCVLASIAISHSLDNYMKPVFSNKDGACVYLCICECLSCICLYLVCVCMCVYICICV